MKVHVFGSSDGTGSPSYPGTLLIFGLSEEEATAEAARIYALHDEECIYQGELLVEEGDRLLATSYYGVSVDHYKP